MMKLLSCMLLVASATAFSPPAFGVSRTVRPTTKTFLVDPDAVHHLAQLGLDAARMVVLECSDQECSTLDGWKESDGWHFENRMGADWQTPGTGHTYKILMIEADGTE